MHPDQAMQAPEEGTATDEAAPAPAGYDTVVDGLRRELEWVDEEVERAKRELVEVTSHITQRIANGERRSAELDRALFVLNTSTTLRTAAG